MVGIGLSGFGGGEVEQLGRADGVPLRNERQRGALPILTVGGASRYQVVGGLADRAAQRDTGGVGPAAQCVQCGAVVMVTGHGDDVGAGGAQCRQCPHQELLGCGRWRGGLEQVAGNDHQVRFVGSGQFDELSEYRDLFGQPRLALQRRSDVPVGCVQYSQVPRSLSAGPAAAASWLRL